MYKVLNIGGKDYHLEYSIEASLYADCVESITDVFGGTSAEDDEKMSRKERVKELFSSMANLPKTTLTVFYAGLLEAHGDSGDKTVPDIATAKELVKQYITEHKDDDTGNFFGIFNICLEQMAEDGFFKLIGLEALTAQGEETEVKQPKVPQDHKKKTTKVSEK